MGFSDKNDGLPLYPVHESDFEQWLSKLAVVQQKWVKAAGFKGQEGELCSLPDSTGQLSGYAFGMAKQGWLNQLASLPDKLPEGHYRLAADWSREQRMQASLGWGLACYQFSLYRKPSREMPTLSVDEDIAEESANLLAAQSLVRDLVNTTTEDLGPEQLAGAMQLQSDEFDAQMTVVQGVDLLSKNFPAIHAVGRASDRDPRLLKMEWGDKDNPLLALCGKGVCFDTGGLNLKAGSGMGLMKKDMGGAAHVLGLARLIMQSRLPVRLLVLIPAVENSVSGNAYRPGDVLSLIHI